jgi:hypothetical protein
MILTRFLPGHARRPLAVLGAGLTTAALAVAGISASAGAATLAPLVRAQGAVAGEYIVVLKPGTAQARASAAVRRAQAAGGTVRQRYTHALSGFAANLAEDELTEVREDPSVAYVEAVQASQAVRHGGAATRRASAATQPASTTVRPQVIQKPAPWNLDRIDQRPPKLDTVFGFGPRGRGVHAYLVGDGAQPHHPDYTSRMRPGVNLSGDGQGIEDCVGIGTAEADLLGGGVWGVAKQVVMVPVKIVPCEIGYSTTATFVAAMDWIVADHPAGAAAVANLGDWYKGSSAVDTAVTALIDDGVTAVAVSGQPQSGGRAGSACAFSPGRVPGVITVGAVNDADTRDPRYAHLGACIDLWAPGVQVEMSYNGGSGDYDVYEGWGTFYASPHVAGTAATYLETYPTATPAQVARAIDAATTRGVLKKLGTGSPNRLLFSLPANPPPRTTHVNRIESGTALRKGQSITSPNGFYRLTHQTDGNVVLTRAGGRVTWALNRKASWLTMEPGGNLVAYDFGRRMWETRTTGNGASTLRVQDDGNLVVYRGDNRATWASRTSGKVPPPQPAAGTDRIAPGQGLWRAGTFLQSPSERYRVIVHKVSGRLAVRDQTTGRYVFTSPGGDSDWLRLQPDGNLVLVTRAGKVLWSSGTGGKGVSDLVLRNNGNLVLYQRSTGNVTWSWMTGRV